MIEIGQVVRAGGGTVDVRLEASDHCEDCGMCASAGAGAMVLEGIADSHNAAVGDRVEIEVPEGSRLRAALIGYALPVALLVVAYLAGFLLGSAVGADPDTAGAILSGVSIVGVLLWLRKRGHAVMAKAQFQPHVRDIIRRGAPR